MRSFDIGAVAVRLLSRIGFEEDGCWPWLHSVDKDGYGGICIESRQWRANRAIWTFFFGPIPDEILVCHSCDKPWCSNPGHMFLGTNLENIADMDAKGRRNKYGKAKLSHSQILSIREDRRSRKEIADELGINICTVTDVRNRHSWKEIA